MRKTTAKAYAKINLSLDITGVRDDGYHLLHTVMQSISLHDTLTFEKCEEPGIFITCDKEGIPCDERNIVHKAYTALFTAYGKFPDEGVKIDLHKEIPSSAGLGGGSADGAATLTALNELFDLGFKQRELIKIGSAVGADVPFCLCGGTILCEGIGDKLTPLIPLINFRAIVIKTDSDSSTSDAYKRFDSMHIHTSFNHERVLDAIAQGRIRKLGRSIYNVLEFITHRSVIDDAKNALLENKAVAAQMTGSGSAVFGLYKSKRTAEAAYKNIKDRFAFCEICEPVSYGVSLDD